MLKRAIPFLIFIPALFSLAVPAANAGVLDGWAIGVGINQVTENDADESLGGSIKWRDDSWEVGLDYLNSEDVGGIGENNYAFAWAAMLMDFKRPDTQDFGIFGGGGAGFLVADDEAIDWPAGPIVILGWDFSSQAGLEGKVGYFGENIFGTAMFYWYFE